MSLKLFAGASHQSANTVMRKLWTFWLPTGSQPVRHFQGNLDKTLGDAVGNIEIDPQEVVRVILRAFAAL